MEPAAQPLIDQPLFDQPLVDIVVVNWNAGPLLGECIRSVDDARHEGGWELGRLTVVDNASTDGSADGLAPVAAVVRNSSNEGFAKACNRGARLGRASFVLFLNPDTRLHRGTIPGVLAFLARAEAARVGIVGVPLVDDAGVVDRRSCARFPSAGALVLRAFGLDRLAPWLVAPHFLVEWDHSTTREVDQVSGAFFFMRRAVFEELGGFDERFFVYFEDVDLSLRAKHAGWSSVFLATTPSYHAGEGTTRRIKARRQLLSWRSRLAYARKHFSPLGAAVVLLATATVEPAVRTAVALARGDFAGARDTLRATRDLWLGRR